MKYFLLRAARSAAPLVFTLIVLTGCQNDILPLQPGGDTQVLVAINHEVDSNDFTADPSLVSDEDVFQTPSFVPSNGGPLPQVERTQYQRVVTTSTRTKTVTMSGDSTTASVVVTQDRSGLLMLRAYGSPVVVERPFADHGTQLATLALRDGQWQVTSASFIDRPSATVVSPVRIVTVEFTPAGHAPRLFTSASEMLTKANWPAIALGDVAIKVTLDRGGARAFVHERYGRDESDRRKMEMTQDASDPRVFTLTWHPRLHDGEEAFPWRRMLTIDAFDASTLLTTSTAAYVFNNQQWVIPVALQQ